MAENSKIEWTDHTANLWWGCTEVHAGCDNCYASAWANRYGHELWGNDNPRKKIKSTFADLDRYQKQAKAENKISRVFVGSMMDIFEKVMPMIDHKGDRMIYTTDEIRFIFFDKVNNGLYPNLDFLLLTKRPSNINKYIPEHWLKNPPENVMFGASAVDQATFNTVVRQLKDVKGRKFLSLEPQLGPILPDGHFEEIIDWIIQGGESGPKKRPFKLGWARGMRDICDSHGVPYFFKQIDKVQLIPDDLQVRQFPEVRSILPIQQTNQ